MVRNARETAIPRDRETPYSTSPPPPEIPRPDHRPGDPERVHQRLVMAGGLAVDEAEVDRNGDDLESGQAGANDHFALHGKSVAVKAGRAQKTGGVEPEAALRVGDVRLRCEGDTPRREAVG